MRSRLRQATTPAPLKAPTAAAGRALNTRPVCVLPCNLMSGEVAAKVKPTATLQAVDRKGRPIDLAPAWPLLRRLLGEWAPERVQLFGSRARGDASPDSDWDILVVVPEASLVAADPLAPWRLRRDSGVPADVVVYSSREFEAERGVPNTLAYEAASAGVTLYER
jgi:uncharacterized protein